MHLDVTKVIFGTINPTETMHELKNNFDKKEILDFQTYTPEL